MEPQLTTAHLIQEIRITAQELMKSEEIGKQLAGLYASELLQAFETGDNQA